MEENLNREQLDALSQAATGDSAIGTPDALSSASVEPWNLHQAGRLGKEQLHRMSQLHETFARNLSHSLGAYLRIKFEVTLRSVDQLSYQEFLAGVPELTFFGSFRLEPAEARGALQLDLNLAFPLVDLLLGGPGQAQPANREVSEIEELILDGVGQIVCHELAAVWRCLGTRFVFEQRQPSAQMFRVMPVQEKTLALGFDVSMPELKGRLSIAIPAVASSALLRKLSNESVYQRPRGVPVQSEKIKQQLLNSAVRMELGTPALSVNLRDLLYLQRGSLLPLRLRIDEPAVLRFGDRDCWTARPVRSASGCRAAQLLERTVQPEEEEQA